jgi:hypothetical protein
MAKYQTFENLDNSNFTDFRAWAGDVTGIASALSALGLTKLNDTYTAQWANGAAIGAAALSTLAGNLFGAAFPAVVNVNRAGLPGVNFMGAYSSGTAYTVGQVVTYNPGAGQICYICTTNAAAGIAPTTTANWSPYWMEIWEMASSGLPTFYIKLEYGCGSAAVDPQLSVQIGSAYVSNSGVLSGNVVLAEEIFISNTSSLGSPVELDFCSDGANFFACMLARGYTGSTTLCSWFAFEREITGTVAGAPVYGSNYVTLCAAGGGTPRQVSLFLTSTLGPAAISVRLTSGLGVGGGPGFSAAVSQSVNNSVALAPVFPNVGFVGNPLSSVVGLNGPDAVEGSTVAGTVYGSSHSYLVSKTGTAFTSLTSVGNGAVGIRWE